MSRPPEEVLAELWTRPELKVLNGNGASPPAPSEEYVWKLLSDITARPIEFALKPFLQKAAFHLLVGVKNAGKGTWLAHWAAAVTRGDLGDRRKVVWVAIGEDSYGVDVRPRIEAAGGDPSLVTVLIQGHLQLPEGASELARHAEQIGDVGLVIIDPLGGSIAAGKSSNSDQDIRPALAALNWLADHSRAIVIGVRHLSIKHERHAGGALSAVLGSSDWINIPRAVLALMRDDEDKANRHLFVLTGNRVRDEQPGIMFRIEGHTPDGWKEEVTRARVLGASNKDPDELLLIKTTKGKATKTDAARQLILDTLAAADGYEMESDRLDAEVAKKVGCAVKTLRNLRSDMREEGMIRSVPVKDETGTVQRWLVTLTSVGIANSGSGLDPGPESTPPLRHPISKDLVNCRENVRIGDPDPELLRVPGDEEGTWPPDPGLCDTPESPEQTTETGEFPF